MEETEFSWSLISAKDSDASCVLHFSLLHFLIFLSRTFSGNWTCFCSQNKREELLFFSPQNITQLMKTRNPVILKFNFLFYR